MLQTGPAIAKSVLGKIRPGTRTCNIVRWAANCFQECAVVASAVYRPKPMGALRQEIPPIHVISKFPVKAEVGSATTYNRRSPKKTTSDESKIGLAFAYKETTITKPLNIMKTSTDKSGSARGLM